MTDKTVSEKYIALATECEKRAKEAERQSLSPDLSERERREKADEAKGLWQMRGDHIETGMRLDAELGENFRNKASEGGKIRAGKFEIRHNLIRADYAERLERLGDESAAKQATARQFEISRSQLNRILKK